MIVALASSGPIAKAGGLELLVRELIDMLSGEHEVYLASPDDSEGLRKLGVLEKIRGHFEIGFGCEYERSKELVDWLKHNKVQLAHFHLAGTYGWRTATWSKSPITRIVDAGISCITTNHQAISPACPSRAEYSFFVRYAGFVRRWPGKMKALSRVFAEVHVSDHDLRISKSLFPFYARKLRRIYHSRLSEAVEASSVPDSKIILSLASVCFRKGQHILAEAFAKIAEMNPEWKLRMVGNLMEQNCVNQIREIINKYQLEDRLLLTGPSDSPMHELTNCEIYVQPSLLEGLGLSLQEAMAAGRPCIGSRVGGIPELITQDVTGRLVNPGDIEGLASNLNQMIRNREERELFGAAGWKSLRSKGMTREDMYESYLNIYNEILHS